jgi:hypothetical protein
MLGIAYYFSFIIWCSTICGYYIPGFAMALRHMKPLLQVLLLDEITVDLDVVTRMYLLDFFKEEC